MSSFDRWVQYRNNNYFISPYKGKFMRESELDLWEGDSGWLRSVWDEGFNKPRDGNNNESGDKGGKLNK